jgi:hypothetical protein
MDISPGAQNKREYFELYIAVKTLEERLSPEFDITANRWLFNYFTANPQASPHFLLASGV